MRKIFSFVAAIAILGTFATTSTQAYSGSVLGAESISDTEGRYTISGASGDAFILGGSGEGCDYLHEFTFTLTDDVEDNIDVAKVDENDLPEEVKEVLNSEFGGCNFEFGNVASNMSVTGLTMKLEKSMVDDLNDDESIAAHLGDDKSVNIDFDGSEVIEGTEYNIYRLDLASNDLSENTLISLGTDLTESDSSNVLPIAIGIGLIILVLIVLGLLFVMSRGNRQEN